MPGLVEGFQLRDWQSKAVEAWVENGQSGIVEVVTGGGKTAFALAAIELWLAGHPDATSLILVPTVALQDQWAIALQDDFGVSPEDIAVWPATRSMDKPFHIMVINTARTQASRFTALGDLLLVADECHRYASDENRHGLECGPSATIGLSATARRQYDTGYEDVLVPALGPTIFSYTLEQARIDGIVSKFRLTNVEVALSDDEAARYEELTRRIGKATAMGHEEQAMRLALQRSSVSKGAGMRIPAAVRLVDEVRGKRCLVFHEQIDAADTITRLLHERGHSVAAYHTGIGASRRRDNLRQFRKGWIDVLVSCRALDEGIDVPEAEVAVLAASTASQRQRVQRLGRVLRRSEGKEEARVITIYATESERHRLEAEQETLTDVSQVNWQRIGVPEL